LIPLLELARKDLRIEARTKASLLTMLLYSLLIVIAFRAASSVTGAVTIDLLPSMLWVATSVACIMGVMASFEFERHDEATQSSLLAPIERGQVFLGKFLSNLILGVVAAAFTLLLGLVFFPLTDLAPVPIVALCLLAGTAAAMSVLCLVAFIASASSVPRVLLPVAAVPLLIFAVILPIVDATARSLSGQDGWQGGLALVGLCALIITAAGYLLAGPLTEAA
jgi:heme exporter protein B